MLLLLGLLPPSSSRFSSPSSSSPRERSAATAMAVVYALFMPMRAFDITNITGVLRAGGDARVASLIDIAPLWRRPSPSWR